MPVSKRRRPKKPRTRLPKLEAPPPTRQPPTPPPSSSGLPVRACFGVRCLDATLLVERSPPTGGASVELQITSDELHREPPDLSTQLRVYHHPSLGVPDPEAARFGGYVTGLEPQSGNRWLVKAHNMANWGDFKIAGWGVRNHNPLELVYATARSVGMPPERIHIGGWNPASEPMLVVVPVEGMAGLKGLDASDTISVTPDADVVKPFDLGPPELQEAFTAADHWAVGIFEATTMYDAERLGVYVFERVIRRLALAARFTSAETPDGSLRPFHRKRLLEQLKLRPIAGVMGTVTKRTWLRGYEMLRADAVLDPGVLESVGDFIGAPDPRTDEAIAAWRRATLEADPSVAVVALAEAIEFYAAETKVPNFFEDDELAAIREGAIASVDEVRRQRVIDMVGKLNEPSVNMRLRAAVDADGVRYNDAEFALLARFRGLRNKILHGQERKLPDDDELRQALSLVNRLLLVRLKRVRERST